MKQLRHLLCSKKSAAVLTLIVTSFAASAVHAQASCDAVGAVSHHLSLDQANQVRGSGIITSGIQGKSLQLSANSNAYIDSLPIGTSGKLTVGIWIRPANLNSPEARLISQATGVRSADHDFMVSAFKNTGLRFRLRVGNTTHTLKTEPGLLQKLKWNHVAVSYSGTRMAIYHNGKAVAAMDVRGNANPRSAVTGIGNQPPGAGSRPFVGKLDEIVVFNRALNSAQISRLAKRIGLACSSTYAQASSGTQSQASNSFSAAASPAPPRPQPTSSPAPVPVQAQAQAQAPTPVQQAAPQAAEPNLQAASSRPSGSSNLDVYTGNGWPSSNDRLPMGGVFYGTPKAGMMSGNGPISQQNAIRFRAQRSGPIKAIRYNNRILRQTDIDYRCEIYGKGSVWCNCKDANLDTLSCGYTLNNSYTVGNGGLITIEIREDDGSSRNLPGSRVLGTSSAFIPVKQTSKFPTIRLKRQVNLTAGKIYHIVFRNDNPPTNCKFQGVPVSQAKNCPRNKGAMSLNGTQHATDPTSLRRFGPFHGSAGSGTHVRTSQSAPWKSRTGVVAFYEVQYADGSFVGETYAGYDNTNYSKVNKGTRDVEGANVARQVFVVEDANRNVDGLWLNYGHSFLKKASGAPLTVTLKSNAGATLATGTIPASPACSKIATDAYQGRKLREKRRDWMCRTWGYTNLSKNVRLVQGQKYSVEFSAPNGAAFVISSYFSYHGFNNEVNNWKNAKAERSANSGRSWSDWSGPGFFTKRDLPMLFTIVGMPKQLP